MYNESPMRIVIVDDHQVVINGLINILANLPAIEIVKSVREFGDILFQLNVSKPDLLLLDINIAGHNALELIPTIKVQHPELKIVVHKQCLLIPSFKVKLRTK